MSGRICTARCPHWLIGGDDHTPVRGDNGTFTLYNGTNLHLRDAAPPCYIDFAAALTGHTLTLTFLDVGPQTKTPARTYESKSPSHHHRTLHRGHAM